MKLARFMNPEVFAESVAEGKRMEHFYREFDPGSG